MKALFLLFTLLLSPLSNASTFIGNGGNAGDVERLVAIRQIRSTLESIQKKEIASDRLCRCDQSFANNATCDNLKSLNEEQIGFCARVIETQTPGILQVLQQENIKFAWTHEKIYVKDNSSMMAADAVANPDDQSITLNQNRFLNMSPYERVFLLGHEFFHLKPMNGKLIGDAGAIGPFTANNGQRQLLNAVGAALVMASYQNKQFEKYDTTLSRPKAWKHHRVELGFSNVNTMDENDSAYATDEYSHFNLTYRYQFNSPLGLSVSYESYESEKTVRTSIKAVEEMAGATVGVSYRLFPFTKDPLSFLGQSHLVFDLKGKYLQGNFKLNDPYVGLEDNTDVLGASLGCQYYIPLGINMWLTLSLAVEKLDFEYKSVGVKNESFNTITNIGASYGF